jgi:carbonic anhydrase
VITANAALQRLREGNARFVSGDTDCESRSYPVRREQLVAGQDPFAIIVGCSDSRVPVELLFDQGLGELFVIRVAGNVVGKTQLASIEFAAGEYGTQLVVVLGHTGCGAVTAAFAAMQSGDEPDSGNLRRLVRMIRPAAERSVRRGEAPDEAALVDRVCRENVRQSVDAIRNEAGILRRLVDEGRLVVVGAEYSLTTGLVEFF